MTIRQLSPYGKPMLKHWLFDPAYKNLNHGSYGAHPAVVRNAQRAYQELADGRPDRYVRQLHAELLDEARQDLATLINASRDECVFVRNATTGVATVLYNLNFQPGEAVIYFEPVYGAVENGITSLKEHTALQARKVHFQYPISEEAIERRFREVVLQTRQEGLKVRAAVFDTIHSVPGVRFPFERFVGICREEGILSVIDGAHGIGQIPLDMNTLQPDFLVSNCHKWLYTPRSAAVLYVPKRNQHFMHTTLPTSWGFIPTADSPHTPQNSEKKSSFEELFQLVATDDYSAYICVGAALKFRKEICGGEDAVMRYCQMIANEGADIVAAALGTKVLQEPDLKPGEASQMRACALTTVQLPIAVAGDQDGAMPSGASVTLTPEEADRASEFCHWTLLRKYDTFVPVFRHGSWLWTRLSGQVYLEKADFEWLGGVLGELCEQIARKEFQ
ncbi:hypothetical protein N7474_011119 [Penicillium riverlandense]|uniref:uncharacterized protein n=1 Tax=Penicillium riverlandense TaxID=1903569 RepID=UPI00254943FD|nr:uncharacterized protein N7474_011119 [Penicillium riverlandense]KAJ5805232.1 hypothetical protein N7474_011119 [Penicillium riverlandense]